MTGIALVAAALAAALLSRPSRRGPPAAPARSTRRRRGALDPPALRALGVVTGALLAVAGLGPLLGLLAGGALALGLPVLVARLAAQDDDGREIRAAVPVTAGLLGAALSAGADPQAALGRVAPLVPGPLGARLGQVVQALAVGSAPTTAWELAGPECALLRDAYAASWDDGSALAGRLGRAADQQAEVLRTEAVARAERVGIRVVLPLGLCFLPAFVAVAVVPVVSAALSTVRF